MGRWSRCLIATLLWARGLHHRLTLGARTAVIVNGQVLLVRHGYVAGWQLPGGAVDPGESAEEAARREVIEETGYAVEGALTLLGFYHATTYTNRDHVAVYVARAALQVRSFTSNREIAEIGWFALDDLPEPMAPSALRRLAEIKSGSSPSSRW